MTIIALQSLVSTIDARGQTQSTNVVKRIWTSFRTRREQRIATAHLRAMNDHLLKDIGISRSQIDMAVRGELR